MNRENKINECECLKLKTAAFFLNRRAKQRTPPNFKKKYETDFMILYKSKKIKQEQNKKIKTKKRKFTLSRKDSFLHFLRKAFRQIPFSGAAFLN